MSSKCLLVIPARYQSTRLPRKLLLAETGKPLICHTVDMAVAVCRRAPKLVATVIVATDHEDIFNAVREYAGAKNLPATAVMTRPDHQSGTDRVAEAVAGFSDDVIINLQGDEPEMSPKSIIRLAHLMTDNPGLPMATLGYKLPDAEAANPNVVKIVCDAEMNARYFSRAPIPYNRDGVEKGFYIGHLGIYAYRRAALQRLVSLPVSRLEKIERLEQLRALENGIDIRVQVLPSTPPKGIDTREDYDAFVARMAGCRHADYHEIAVKDFLDAPDYCLDVEPLEKFESAVRKAFSQEEYNVLVDFDKVSAISSFAAGLLTNLQSQAQEHGGEIALTRTSPKVLSTLNILGLNKHFTLLPPSDDDGEEDGE